LLKLGCSINITLIISKNFRISKKIFYATQMLFLMRFYL